MKASSLISRALFAPGACQRVSQSNRDAKPTDREHSTYRTPLERRIDSMLARSRART